MIYANITHSKELKDLFPDAEWWWVKTYDIETRKEGKKKYWRQKDTLSWGVHNSKCGCSDDKVYPALTTDMLLEILPKKQGWFYIAQDYDRGAYDRYDEPVYIGWAVWFRAKIKGKQYNTPYRDKYLNNALCKMVKYLRDSGLLKEESNGS